MTGVRTVLSLLASVVGFGRRTTGDPTLRSLWLCMVGTDD